MPPERSSPRRNNYLLVGATPEERRRETQAAFDRGERVFAPHRTSSGKHRVRHVTASDLAAALALARGDRKTAIEASGQRRPRCLRIRLIERGLIGAKERLLSGRCQDPERLAEIVKLIGERLSYRAIGERLGIAAQAVHAQIKTHRPDLLRWKKPKKAAKLKVMLVRCRAPGCGKQFEQRSGRRFTCSTVCAANRRRSLEDRPHA